MKNDKDNIQLSAVEDHDGILTIRGGGARRDWNGIHYKQGMSAKNVGTTKLSANIATIPPGGVAYAHIHVGFELILYILEGKVRHEFGPGLKQTIENEAGDFIYIKPGVPHEVFNMSQTNLSWPSSLVPQQKSGITLFRTIALVGNWRSTVISTLARSGLNRDFLLADSLPPTPVSSQKEECAIESNSNVPAEERND